MHLTLTQVLSGIVVQRGEAVASLFQTLARSGWLGFRSSVPQVCLSSLSHVGTGHSHCAAATDFVYHPELQ